MRSAVILSCVIFVNVNHDSKEDNENAMIEIVGVLDLDSALVRLYWVGNKPVKCVDFVFTVQRECYRTELFARDGRHNEKSYGQCFSSLFCTWKDELGQGTA